MNRDPQDLYAVVRHSSGRVDFEPVRDLIVKNQGDLEEGRPVMRALLGLSETTVEAQEKAREFRTKKKSASTPNEPES